MKKIALILLSLMIIIFIAGCTQQPTGQTLVQPQTKYVCPDGSVVNNPNLCSNSTNISNATNPELANNAFACDANCTGSAGQCKEHQCVDGKCTIITLSNCCGNKICEEGENYANCSDCESPYKFERMNGIKSCREEGKVKILEFENETYPVQYYEPILEELKKEFNIELTFHAVAVGYVYNSYAIMNKTTDELAERYKVEGTPTFIINCNIKYIGNKEGYRDINSFRLIFNDTLSGLLI
jgi:thiol-disulfide isomerase/thioredoxin